jgi:uncharacterized protein (DUF934 family)
MSLRDILGEKADPYQRASAGYIAERSHILVPLTDLDAARAGGGNRAIGIEVPNSTKLGTLFPLLDQVALIAITFPLFSECLRNAGFTGTLRAVGPLIADQFAYALACGFDEVELPPELAARQPVEIWLAAARAYRATYQTSHQADASSILERRRARAFSNEGMGGSHEQNTIVHAVRERVAE